MTPAEGWQSSGPQLTLTYSFTIIIIIIIIIIIVIIIIIYTLILNDGPIFGWNKKVG